VLGPTVLLLVLTPLLQVVPPTLDEVLSSSREGEVLRAAEVPSSISEQALQRVVRDGAFLDGEEAAHLLAVVDLHAPADEALATALVPLLLATGDEALVDLLVQRLAQTPQAANSAAGDDLRWRDMLLELAELAPFVPDDGDVVAPAEAKADAEIVERTAAAAITLLALRLAPLEVVDLCEAWDEDWLLEPRRGHLLLETARLAPPTPELLDALLNLHLPLEPDLFDTVGVAFGQLIVRDEALALRAVELVERGEVGPLAGLLRGLGSAPPALWDRALQVADGLLVGVDPDDADAEDPALLAAALEVGGIHLSAKAAELTLLLVARPRSPIVRRAAARAAADVSYRDAWTIGTLITALETEREREVCEAIYQALLRKSGTDLPARPAMWRLWVRTQDLPQQPPQSHQDRLAQERNLRRIYARAQADREAREARRRGPQGD
jgi:hypothetical protein